MLSAIRSTGVMKGASIVFDGPTDAVVFRCYVEQCLAPTLTPGDIVVMDNLASHRVTGIVEAIERVGASVWYLPPYSPDMNPIERFWQYLKGHGMAGYFTGDGEALSDKLCESIQELLDQPELIRSVCALPSL